MVVRFRNELSKRLSDGMGNFFMVGVRKRRAGGGYAERGRGFSVGWGVVV
jgi:hypothetical protein